MGEHMGSRSLLRRGRLVGALAVACVSAVALSTTAAYAEPAPGRIVRAVGTSVVPDSYVVVFKSTVDRKDVATRSGSLATRFGGKITRTYRHAVNGFEISMPAAAAQRLAADSSVAIVEENGIVRVSDTQTPAGAWGLDRIDQRSVLLDDRYHFVATAAGVKAYIIDTGIRLTHNEFGGRAISGIDTIDGGSADDLHGHGTHVAGIVGGATYGVAKRVALVAVRVMDQNGTGTVGQALQGIDWVTADHQAGQTAVANMSLRYGPSEVLDTAVRNSIADGISYGVSAGNNRASACGQSPARVPTAITVAATTFGDVRASFSNDGPCVDLFAPGTDILSAHNSSDTATATLSGTSMAAPHVVGVAALLLSQLGPQHPQSMRDLIVATATSGVVADPGVDTPNKLLFSGPTIPVADFVSGVARFFSGQLRAVNGTQPYVWSVTGLPPGLSASSTGLITGIPRARGQYTVTGTVTDAVGRTTSRSFPWAVVPVNQTFVGSASASRPPTALMRAEEDARQQAAEAGYGQCQVIGRSVESSEPGTWDATVTVNCVLLD
jgi:subtilisin family serine protease